MAENNEMIQDISFKIAETEQDIDILNEKINGLQEEKKFLTEKYEASKERFETVKSDYTYKSTSGRYFFWVSAIAFAVIVIGVLTDAFVDFFLLPAGILFAIGIVLRLIGLKKFSKMAPEMKKASGDFAEDKDAYDEFMAEYSKLEKELEAKQYQWEIAENDKIEARKEAWIANQKANKAVAAAKAAAEVVTE